METRALAKINLGLWVIGQRDDGYHEIITVLHLINLSDKITIEPSPTLSVECDACPAGPENLAWKAAEVMGRTNITIRIKKGIPVGGGLGGGSADAGAVMRAIRGSLSDEDLIKIGARIGSDVPFFASGLVSALARGRGELITPLRSNLSAKLVLFIPCKGVDTGWAYGLLRESGTYEDRGEAERAASKLCEAVERGDLDELSRWAFNSFERVIMRQRPKLAEAREALLGAGAKIALLSGSGGVVYGLFPEDSPAPELPELGGKWVATTIGGQIGNPCS